VDAEYSMQNFVVELQCGLRHYIITVIFLNSLNSHLSECYFTVYGKPIELVQSFQHLGHTTTSQLSDVSDITAEQNAFIGQTNNVLFFQEAKFEC